MTKYEYNTEKAAWYKRLAETTKDEHLKIFYRNAARGHELRLQLMSIEEAEQPC